MNRLKKWYALTVTSLVGHQVTQLCAQAAELAPASSNPLPEISGHFSKDINPSSGETAPLEKGTFDEGSLPVFAGEPKTLNRNLKAQSDHLKLNKISPLQGLFGHSSARFNASIVRPTLIENNLFLDFIRGKDEFAVDLGDVYQAFWGLFLDPIRSKDEFAVGLGYAYQSFRGLFQLSLDGLAAPTSGGSPFNIPLAEGNTAPPTLLLGSGSLVFGIRGTYKDMLLIGAFAGCKVLGGQRKRKDGWASPRYSGMVWGFEGAFPAFKGNVEIQSKGQKYPKQDHYIGLSNYAKIEVCVEVGEILTWRWQSLAKYHASAFKVGFQFVKFKIPEIKADEVYCNGGNAETSAKTALKVCFGQDKKSVFAQGELFWTVSAALTNQLELKLFGQIRGEGLSRLPFGVNLNWQSLPNRLGLKHHLVGGRRLSARERVLAESYSSIKYSTAPIYQTLLGK